jgi:dipeptidase
MMKSTPQSCDTMVALKGATDNGQTIFAKNSDRPRDECQPLVLRERIEHPRGAVTRCQFVSLPESGVTYRHVGSRPYWCWGYEHGFNEHQVVIGNEALFSRYEFSEPKLVGMELLRLGLERGRTAAEAVEAMTDAISRIGQGKFTNPANVRTYDNGFIVADPKEAYILETAGHHWAAKRVQGAIGISNVYSLEADWDAVSPGAEADAVRQGWWQPGSGRFNFAGAFSSVDRFSGSGFNRRARSCAVLRQRSGDVRVRTMMAILSDHADGAGPEGFQTALNPGKGICMHSTGEGAGATSNTAASLVADLCADGSRLPVYWCSLYSPCLGIFLPTFIEGQLPPVLSVGGATPGDGGPWWLFHRLAAAVRRDPEAWADLVRNQWKVFQAELFETAFQHAAEGRRLMDAGRSAQAFRLLTGYMANNTATMLARVSELLTLLEAAPLTSSAARS